MHWKAGLVHLSMDGSPERFERGDAEVFGLLSFAPVLVALITLIAFTAVVRSAQVPVFAAARECARVASAFLDPTSGASAGRAAASASLDGNQISVEGRAVTVGGHSGSGSNVTCTVRQRIALRGLPMAGWVGVQEIDVTSSASAYVERHKSR